ncbi:MAG TPA: hypothetical protein VK063_03260 [Beutenbergiaceae bacterium]|nr:hypothetical protein [Beutenbergiaceae bacterium]
MFVVTADQDKSSVAGEQVEAVLAHLERTVVRPGSGAQARMLLPFQRTVGDEIQGVFSDARACLDAALELQRLQQWAVGIGIGAGTLAREARASGGPAFVHARTAVERARSKAVTVPLALAAEAQEQYIVDTEALLQLLSAVVRRRSEAGWEVVDRLRAGAATYREVAKDLGISAQAVGQRLRVALWSEERAVHPLAVRLLGELDEGTG